MGPIFLYFAVVFALIAAVFVERVERGMVAIHFGWLAIAFYFLHLIFGGR